MNQLDDIARDAHRVIHDLREIANRLEREVSEHCKAEDNGTQRPEWLANSLLVRYANAIHSIGNYVGAQGHTSPTHLIHLAQAIAKEDAL